MHVGTTPPAPLNPPGQARITHRRARHADLRAAMIRALGSDLRLRGLTSRDLDEPAIALTDAWAAALSVTGFYHERIAHEGFLGTAVELRSVLQLARAIGYELRPGVAASTALAVTVSAPPGAPDTLPIPIGTRVQSVPGPDETPQTFETAVAIDAKPAWNGIPARATAPRAPRVGDELLRLLGTDLVLAPGDTILIVGPDPTPWYDLRRVDHVDVVQEIPTSDLDRTPLVPAHTLVSLDDPIATQPLPAAAAAGVSGVEVHVLRQRAALFGYNAQPWNALPVSLRVGELDPSSLATTSGGSTVELLMKGPGGGGGPGESISMIPKETTSTNLLTGAYAGRASSWADATLGAGTTTIHLDQSYPAAVTDSWLVLRRNGAVAVRRIGAVAEVPHTDFGLSAKVTRVDLVGGDAAGFSPKNASVSLVSEQLTPAPWPIETPVGASTVAASEAGTIVAGRNRIELDRSVPDLPVGRTVVVRGTAPGGSARSELAEVASVAPGPWGSTLLLAADLVHEYRRIGTVVLGNVVAATHGESRAEVLGSGDHTATFQRFVLRQSPVTHVAAATGQGSASTLAIWVDGVRWTEVPTLHGRAPDDRVYTTRRADDGTVTVIFGDGITGRRLPSGRDNVIATYRVGIGTAATLGVDRLTLPMSRPLGLDAVTNPIPATGAADPEVLADARTNAPRTVRTLGRVVSVDDYADYARTFAGVGKARGDVLWDGVRRIVHLTVAGASGTLLGPTSTIPGDLRAAIDRDRHPTIHVEISPHVPATFVVTLRLLAAADRRWDDVAAALQAELLDRFSIAARDFAHPVAASDVVAAAHGVAGVEAVVLTAFHRSDAATERADAVLAAAAHHAGGVSIAAELLSIDPSALVVEPA